MNNKHYRMSEFINPADGRSLVVDTSNSLVLGVLPGLEHFADAVNPLLPLLDGIVTSPGQARKLGPRTNQEAALLIRADWTNALRGDDFVLPPETIVAGGRTADRPAGGAAEQSHRTGGLILP
jgi:DhnA family fructose-bisphosphate aldolase class Ia